MVTNLNQKNEMDALYQAVKEMNEMQLRLMRLYAQNLLELDAATNAQLLHAGNYMVQGSTFIH